MGCAELLRTVTEQDRAPAHPLRPLLQVEEAEDLVPLPTHSLHIGLQSCVLLLTSAVLFIPGSTFSMDFQPGRNLFPGSAADLPAISSFFITSLISS